MVSHGGPIDSDMRGQAGVPPTGRRKDDAPLQELSAEYHELNAKIDTLMRGLAPPKKPLSISEMAGLITTISVIVGAVMALVVWLGGGIIGPGARFEDYKRERIKLDSISGIERRLLLRQTAELSGIVARFGYDMCMMTGKRSQQECFDGYLAENARLTAPLGIPLHP